MKRLVSSLLLALLLTVAAQAIWAMGYAWIETLRSAFFPRETVYEQVQVRRDRSITVMASRSKGTYWVRSLRTLDHQPVAVDEKNPAVAAWTVLHSDAEGGRGAKP